MSKQYNLIYEKLVKNENDILGIVAYSVYKRQKIDFIKSHTDSEQDEQEPLPGDKLASFMAISTSDAQLSFYEEAAANILDEYANLSESEKIDELEANHSEELEQKQKEYDRKLRNAKSTNFMYGVWQSLTASILLILVLGVFTFILWSSKQGFVPMIEEISQKKILDKAEYEKLLKQIELNQVNSSESP
ncbi:hypothetical protein [Vibrio parahaemolyticus]|nr:hypothetical protein [Vibrio parahaemolyticus]